MATTERMSLYLTDEERAALRGAAHSLNASENYIMRLALRQLTELPLSELNRAEISHVKHTLVHTSTP